MLDSAQRRLLPALTASALLHVWLVQTGDSGAARRVTPAVSATMSATLRVAHSDFGEAHAQARPHEGPHEAPQPREITGSVAVAAHSAAVRARLPGLAPAPVAKRATAESSAMPAAVSDPTYYPALSLDVYPRALTALDLGSRAQAGTVRATVLIDEAGTVNDVRAIEAGATEVENAARELLLRARFTPAAKDGRAVKAQLLVSLEYRAGGGQN